MELANLADYKFVIEPHYYIYGWSKDPRCRARRSVAEMLVLARTLLPSGYNFKIWDGRRRLKTHKLMLESFARRLRYANPAWTKAEIQRNAKRFSARLEEWKKITAPDSHKHGGAFDLTIVNEEGEELDMGTDHDDLTARAALDYYEKLACLTEKEMIPASNRHLLKEVMTEAGFQPYIREWWHWSTNK